MTIRSVIQNPVTYIIFTKSLESSTLSDEWKIGYVTLIFKKGNRHLPNNYRPISLTLSVANVLESIVRDSIFHHMFQNDLIDPNQHGFTSCILLNFNCHGTLDPITGLWYTYVQI